MKTFTRIGASAAILSICFFFAGCGGVGVAEAGVPAISQIIPQTLAAGSPDTTLEIVGARINAATVVLWNGNPLATTLVNDTTVASPVESASLAVPGVAQVQLMNGVTGSKSDAVQLSISAGKVPALSIATTSLPGATVGTAYNAPLTATGGTQPYTWRFASGRFPAGLSLNVAGAITGTPTAAGTYSIGLTVRDSGRPAQQKFIALTLIVAANTVTVGPLNIVTTSLSAANYGSAYSQTLQATGGTPSYNWTIASGGALPPGLTLAGNGVLSGTPSQAGTFAFAARVTDSGAPSQSQAISLSIVVSETPLSITTSSLAAGAAGSGYSQTLSASGGSPAYRWSIASGSLPAGLALSSAGAITGTPTASGAFSFTAAVSDTSNPVQTRTAAFSLIVSAVPLHVSTASLASATAGIAYSQSLSATGGTPGYSWSIASGALPAGLSLSSNGAITGTPANSGSVTFVATVSDSGNPMQTQSATFGLTVGAPQLKIAPASFAQGIFGRPYNGALQATGGTPGYKWAVASGNLPAGLSLNSSTGSISGTPTVGGTTAFTASVSDSSNPAQTAQAQVTISVAAVPVTITAAAVSSATAGSAYSQTLQASGGSGPYTWSITSGQLPAGLSLSAASGVISGTPSTPGTSSFTATAADSSNPTQTASLGMSLIVNPGQSMLASLKQLSLLVPASASGVVGTAYAQTLSATGGTGSYTWSITSGSLPSGLTLSAAGVISGTPAAGSNGSYTFTVSAVDSGTPPQTSSATVSMTISAAASPLSIASTTLAAGTTGTAYMQSLQATGGTPGYNWSIASGQLPAGLTLAASGVISGTPTTAGNASFTATVSDSGSPAQTQSLTASIAIAAAQQVSGPGTTWYVRADGGTRYSTDNPTGQCNGQADAPYSGSGVNRACAFSDVRWMWMTGGYGNSQWVMNGGDTLVIRGCATAPTQQNPDPNPTHCRIGLDSANGPVNVGSLSMWCAGVNAWWGCSMPPPPSGTASQHTRILGACAATGNCNPVNTYPYTNNNLTQLYGGFDVTAVIWLNGSQYVDIEGLEITSHNGQCTRVGYPQYPKGCSTSTPVDDFANWGLSTNNSTSNITLQDVYIHGLSNVGIQGPIGGPWTMTRVFIGFNAFAAWNFDDGSSTPDAPGSSLTQSYVTMIGNGCLEEYPIVHTQFPAKACWDSSDGGFGDAWSGQNTELDGFSCDHCLIAYNAKDGAMGPHTLIKNLTLTNSQFYGNMGQQGKWGTTQNATTLIQDNLIMGNCLRMSQQLPGAAQNFNISTGLPGSYLSNYCRAAGDVFAYLSDANSTVLFAGNTVVATSPTVFDMSCATASNCGTTPYVFKDNIFLGYTSGMNYYPFTGQAPGLFYRSDPSVSISSSYNVEYGVRNGDCSSGGTGIVCSDPLLVNEPAQGSWPAESVLDNFNIHPTAASPAIGAGVSLSGLTLDFYGLTQSNPPTIGAAQP